MVHKGLDLVLEAFARMPECQLTIVGPVRPETTPVIPTLEQARADADLARQLAAFVGEACKRCEDACLVMAH